LRWNAIVLGSTDDHDTVRAVLAALVSTLSTKRYVQTQNDADETNPLKQFAKVSHADLAASVQR
jgi:hypothetical protein